MVLINVVVKQCRQCGCWFYAGDDKILKIRQGDEIEIIKSSFTCGDCLSLRAETRKFHDEKDKNGGTYRFLP